VPHPGIDLASYIDQIDEEIDHLCSLRFSDAELDYMRGLRFVKPDFADFLGLFHLDRKYIQLRASTAVPGEIDWTSPARGCTPSCSKCRCWRSSTKSGSATPPRPTSPKASAACRPRPRCCAIPRFRALPHRRLRQPPPLLA
jgi:hypothetical protein